MCKTFDAIHKLSKAMRKDGECRDIKIFLNHFKVEGELACADDDVKCFEDVITLRNAITSCPKNPEATKEFEWLNIPSHQIIAFTFSKCDE